MKPVNSVTFKFEYKDAHYTIMQPITPQTQTIIINQKINELCDKYGLVPTDIKIEFDFAKVFKSNEEEPVNKYWY